MLEFDAFESTASDPWPEIARDRAKCPVAHVRGPGGFEFYQVATYDLVREVSKRHEDFSNRMGVIPRGAEEEGEQVLEFADPPEHTLHRKLIGKAFSAARVNERAQHIQEVADDLVDEIAARGNRFRLRHEFARELPSRMIAEILGVPLQDRAQFIAWSESGEEGVGDVERPAEMQVEQNAFLDYCLQQLRQRRQAPRDDLLSTIVNAQIDGIGLSDREAAAMVRLLLAAGNGTTSIGISNLVYLLETNPVQKAKLLANMDLLLESTVEEGFRFDCPVQGNLRGVLHDATIGGVPVRAGDRLYAFYSAANHDPDKYDRPDEFLVDRDWSTLPRHLAFGHGIHFCVGAELARAEAQIAIRTLYTRLPNLRIRDGYVPQQTAGMVFRTWREIEMEFDGEPRLRLS